MPDKTVERSHTADVNRSGHNQDSSNDDGMNIDQETNDIETSSTDDGDSSGKDDIDTALPDALFSPGDDISFRASARDILEEVVTLAKVLEDGEEEANTRTAADELLQKGNN